MLADGATLTELISWVPSDNFPWKYVPEEGYFGWWSLYVAPEKPGDGKDDGGR